MYQHLTFIGFLQDVLFQITSLGYVPETLNAMVNGIVKVSPRFCIAFKHKMK